jgi:hypothetical protein
MMAMHAILGKKEKINKMNRQAKIMQIIMVLFLLGTWASIGFGQETAQQIVNRALRAYSDQWKGDGIKDWVGTGKIKILGDQKSQFNFTLSVKQKDKVELRVMDIDGKTATIRDGSDGSVNWHSSGPFSGKAAGSAAHFIDSQTSRSIARLFDSSNSLKDLGAADKKYAPESGSSRIIEATNDKGKVTRYYVDNTTSLITRIEFETGTFYTILMDNQKHPHMASFVFSDYRLVNGILTPFKIGVYADSTKIKELSFTSVKYNAGVKDAVFVP